MTTYKVWNDHFKCFLPLLAEYDRYGETTQIVDDGIECLCNRLKWRAKHDYQNVVEINGGTGSGKSTLAIDICKTLDPNWDLEKNYIYTVKDLKEKLKNYKTANPISLFDEGSVILNSLDFMSKDSKDVVMLFDTMRCLNWTTIICIPDHNSLNKRIRDFHIDYRCICPNKPILKGYDKRGFVEIHYHHPSDFGKAFDPHIMTTRYNDLKPKERNEYNQIKFNHLQERMSKFVEEEED